MRWILYAMAALAVLVVLVVIVGAMLPKKHTASRRAAVALPPEDGEVYNVIFRFMSRFVLGHYATMDGYLRNLQAIVNGSR